MLAGIPVQMLERTVLQLLGATKTVSMGRDRDPVSEPDNAVRLRVLELIVEQGAGAAPSRKPVEPVSSGKGEQAKAGMLRATPKIPSTKGGT